MYRYLHLDQGPDPGPRPDLLVLADDGLTWGQTPTSDESRDDHPAASSAAPPQLLIARTTGEKWVHGSGIITAQKRVQALLAANQSIVADLTLSVVLRRIVEAAAVVAGARQAAFGVIGPDGLLEQFVHTGMDSGTVQAIGERPECGHGLEMVAADAEPCWLSVTSDDSRSSTLPAGHPRMTSFVSVPIRCRGVTFGNLYLTDRKDGCGFDDEDIELLEALATTAGIAVDNARLYEDAERRQLWLRASSGIIRELSSGTGQELVVLQHIAASMQVLTAADVVTVVLPDEEDPDGLQIAVATGFGQLDLDGIRFPASGSLVLHVMEQGHGVMIGAGGERSWTVHLGTIVPNGPVMALPLTGKQSSRGAIVVGRESTRAPFHQTDLDLAESFTEQAALALELAEARTDLQRLTVLEDRDRIGRDLHDHVIQRLFAAELGVQSLAGKVTQPEVQAGLVRTITELTATIRQIRSTIFALQQPAAASVSLRRTISLLIAQLSPLLGFRPEVHLIGPLDTLADDEMLSDVEAVLRESLTNINRHAGATAAQVTVEANSRRLVVTVSDNGVGLHGPGGWSGLSNLKRRAEDRAGSLSLGNSPEGGLRLQWTISLTI